MSITFTGADLVKRSNDLVLWLADRGLKAQLQSRENSVYIDDTVRKTLQALPFDQRFEFIVVSTGLTINGDAAERFNLEMESRSTQGSEDSTLPYDKYVLAEREVWMTPADVVYRSKRWNTFMGATTAFRSNPLRFALFGANAESRRKRALFTQQTDWELFLAQTLPHYVGIERPTVGTGPDAYYELVLWLAANKDVPFEEGVALYSEFPKEARILLIRQGGKAQLRFNDLLMEGDRQRKALLSGA